jgi:hypothetical protein
MSVESASLLGIRLQLLLGSPDTPRPAPFEVMDALVSVQVTNNDRERDAFQMEFNLGRDSLLEYGLLRAGVLDAGTRVIIMMLFGALPQVLIDGMILDQQIIPSNEPGRSRLRVTGDDISVKLSFEDQNATYPHQSDSDIVKKILSDANFTPQVTQTTDTPSDKERISTQQRSNLQYVFQLAQRNGFVFFVEPTNIPGFTNAYWGPEPRQGAHQPPLSLNLGPQTNVDTPINFHFNALSATDTQVTIIDPFTKQPINVPPPSAFLPALSGNPAVPLRKVKARQTANLTFAQALLRTITSVSASSDVMEAEGEVDAVRYGQALRARRLVDIQGAGRSNDGTYYVRQVIHNIQRLPVGAYKQRFMLRRDGRGSLSNRVTGQG